MTARQIDIVRLEKFAGAPWVKLTGAADNDGNPTLMMEHIWHMAWTASRRADGELADFDAWCDLVDSVLPVGGDDETAPLDRTPSPGA